MVLPFAVNRRQQGFTLTELLIVVAIIGILAAVALPRLMSHMKKGKEAATRSNLDALRKAVQMYAVDLGTNPNRLTGDPNDVDWPDWSLVIIPDFTSYITSIPPCKVSPLEADSRGVWNIVDDSLEVDPAANGWRYGMWPGLVTINNGGIATNGDIYSDW